MQMYEEVSKILAKQLRRDIASIRPDSLIQKELGADSLDILQLLMKIEDEYGIVIPDEELATFVRVQDVVDYLESHNAA